MCWLSKKLNPPAQVTPLMQEYAEDYAKAEVLSNWLAEANFSARKINDGMARYKIVANALAVPAVVVGLCHLMESTCDFITHLFNGDPLTARTIHYPPGQPVAEPRSGKLPYTWEESAIAALIYDEISRFDMSTTAGMLNFLESYNGRGYRRQSPPIKSPYLFSGTQLYTKGKFTEVWDQEKKAYQAVYFPELVSQQIGCVAVMKTLGII